ncbi:MAG: hypothetical protein WCE94_13455 [Candidatus Methanoperedens sp.]
MTNTILGTTDLRGQNKTAANIELPTILFCWADVQNGSVCNKFTFVR